MTEEVKCPKCHKKATKGFHERRYICYECDLIFTITEEDKFNKYTVAYQ